MAEVKDIKEAVKKIVKFGKGEPLASYTLVYDSQSNQLEPIYYWLLDFMEGMGIKVEKITDNFTSSPGSGSFAEMGQRATRMQEEGMKIMGMVNQVIKTVLNLVYDLKEFEIRLEHYDDADSDDKVKKESGMLALKQVWLDNVDMKRGRGSIHQMASLEMGFSTLREAFFMSNTLEDVKKNEIINDQVKRILEPRVSEFLKWKKYSQEELRKRFAIEKSYLKTEVESLKLYTSWAKPYLRAANDLKQRGFDGHAALVNAFSTSMFELTLLGTSKSTPFGPVANYNFKRDYYSVFVINFLFRGHVSQRATQKCDYAFAMGGKVDMKFDCYALSEEELKYSRKILEKEELNEILRVADTTEESLIQLHDDIDHFIYEDKYKEKAKKEEEAKKKAANNIDPFSALFGGVRDLFKKSEKKKDKKDDKDLTSAEALELAKKIKPDNYYEKYLRNSAIDGAKGKLYVIYDVYKKAHGMASSPEDFENYEVSKDKL